MILKKMISIIVAVMIMITAINIGGISGTFASGVGITDTFNWIKMAGFGGNITRTDAGIQMQGSGEQALINYFYNSKYTTLDGFNTTLTFDNVTPFAGGGHQSYIGIQFGTNMNEAMVFNNAFPGLMIILAPNQLPNKFNTYALMNNGSGLSGQNFSTNSSFIDISNGGSINITLKKDTGGNWHIFMDGTDVGCDLSSIKSLLDSGCYFGIKAYENNQAVASEQIISITARQINGEALGNHLDIPSSSIVKSTKINTDANATITSNSSGMKMFGNVNQSGLVGFKYAIGDPVRNLNGFTTIFKIDSMDGYNGLNGVSNNINFGLSTFNATSSTSLPAGYVNSDRMDVWDYFGAPISSARSVQIRFYRNSDTFFQTLIFILGSNGGLESPADFLDGNNVTIGADGNFNVSIIKNGLNWCLLVNGQSVLAGSNDAGKIAAFNAELDAISEYGATPVYSNAYDILGNLSSANTSVTVKSINNRPIGLNTENPVTGVLLNKTSTTLTVGATEVLTATLNPVDSTNQNVTWTSSNPLVASVVNGEVKALLAGTSRITVTTQDGNLTAICEVTVNSVFTLGNYILSDHTITNVAAKTSVTQFLLDIKPVEEAIVTFKDNTGTQIFGDTYVGTGSTIVITANNITTKYTVIIFGDIDGDGEIDLSDLVLIKDNLLELPQNYTNTKISGDLYNEGNVTLNDLVGLMSYISEVGTINQNKGVEVYNVYNFEKFMKPYWEGTTVYNEAVMILANQDGTIDDAPLMYNADNILSVHNGDLSIEYERGVDWQLQDGKIKILPGSAITITNYSDYYLSSPLANHSFACTNGGYIYFSEGPTFHNKQIAVTYTHSQTWTGPIPEYKGTQLPNTMSKLVNNEPVKVLFYGDSITEGANSTGFMNVSPNMPSWTNLFVNSLKVKYNNTNITSVNTAVGGQNSVWGAQNAVARGADHHPDLAVIAFGMNDGTLVSVDGFKINIGSIMDTIKATNPDCEFILVASMIPNAEVSGFLGNQPYYYTALSSLQKTGVVMANVTQMHQYLLTKKRYYDMTGNNVNHPNDFIVRLYAQTISALLVDN